MPDMETLAYWISRLEPIIRCEAADEVIVVIANRCGSENAAVYAGTSVVMGIKSGEVRVYGILGRDEKELLVVDTSRSPLYRLVREDVSAISVDTQATDASGSTVKTQGTDCTEPDADDFPLTVDEDDIMSPTCPREAPPQAAFFNFNAKKVAAARPVKRHVKAIAPILDPFPHPPRRPRSPKTQNTIAAHAEVPTPPRSRSELRARRTPPRQRSKSLSRGQLPHREAPLPSPPRSRSASRCESKSRSRAESRPRRADSASPRVRKHSRRRPLSPIHTAAEKPKVAVEALKPSSPMPELTPTEEVSPYLDMSQLSQALPLRPQTRDSETQTVDMGHLWESPDLAKDVRIRHEPEIEPSRTAAPSTFVSPMTSLYTASSTAISPIEPDSETGDGAPPVGLGIITHSLQFLDDDDNIITAICHPPTTDLETLLSAPPPTSSSPDLALSLSALSPGSDGMDEEVFATPDSPTSSSGAVTYPEFNIRVGRYSLMNAFHSPYSQSESSFTRSSLGPREGFVRVRARSTGW